MLGLDDTSVNKTRSLQMSRQISYGIVLHENCTGQILLFGETEKLNRMLRHTEGSEINIYTI